jgi:ABC-type polysaccharide/polyol phosphate transport system ATPase subunit
VSEIAIRTRDLRKVYRLYAKPSYRFLDMFGLLTSPRGKFSEHAALDGVSLDIRRGEKVAIIGRNGAGKSTFLKLVTNVIEPTSGSIDVSGRIHALLQIGTGFHPDFTGRQNIYGYLAQLGITGGEAERRCAEIVEFSELEEYIDQPVKTYSTGMAVRLMFSTSTAITPDLLVLDEVLGVGDAYFAHKSFDRITTLCEAAGTTLLLVTHDIYSAIKLCERVIWIDQGRVLMDGEGKTVVKAYEDSVRQQEEQRLRLRKQARLLEVQDQTARSNFIIEFRARDNRAQPTAVYFSSVSLRVGDGAEALVPVGAEAFADTAPAHLQREGSAWGELTVVGGRAARPMQNYGTPFHKVAAVVRVPVSPDVAKRLPAVLAVDYWSELPCELSCSLFLDDLAVDLGPMPPSRGTWTHHEFAVQLDDPYLARPAQVNPTGQHGSGSISATEVDTFDASGRPTHIFRHREFFEMRVAYRINKPDMRERAQVLLAFHRNGVEDVCRTITRSLLFDASTMSAGVITLQLPELPLANGAYTVTVMIAEEGYYDRAQAIFYALNPGVYNCLSKIVEITVEGGGIVGNGTAVVIDGCWSLQPSHDKVPSA